jgi:hypothetical protein
MTDIVINSDCIWASLATTGRTVVRAVYWKLPAIRAQLNAEADAEGVSLRCNTRDDDTLDVSLRKFT